MQQQSWVVWLTGLPASGKTTVAKAMLTQLSSEGVDAVLLDSDELRQVLTPDASYAPDERDRFYSQIIGLAELLARQGVNVIIAATANRRRYRDEARSRLARFVEVWVRCPLEICRERDPKGLYARAESDQSLQLPGVGSDYEPPANAELIIDAQQQSPAESAHCIIEAGELLR